MKKVTYEVLVILSSLLLISGFAYSRKHDFRHISYQDLQLSIRKFSLQDDTSYPQVLFDVSRNQVFLGARDALYRLSLQNLKLLENTTWLTKKEKAELCMKKGQGEKSCHNYIKILLTDGESLFTCGTNGFSPVCSWRKMDNVSQEIQSMDGIAKCPYNPAANVTGYMTENSEYYFGGPTDFSGSDFLISKSFDSSVNTIRTKQYNSQWLNEPQFVGTFETDRFIYFLLREAAVEYINCGKIVYSRIARVCKNDKGGHTMLKDNWTTFLKARLNCSISGDYPFYFDEIQSMTYVAEEQLVYATFGTPPNSIAGSAICSFNLSSIESSFNGPFKYQDHGGSAWGKHNMQHREHYECRSSLQNSHLLESSKYQLMDNAVQATTLTPLFVANLERFTYITVDILTTNLHRSMHVIYVANIKGFIQKISIIPRTQQTCVVEIWQAVISPIISIRGIQFLKETNSVYVSTDTGLLKIKADHCDRHISKESCINAMDPYCGWNELSETCTVAPRGDPLDSYWTQGVTSCPLLDAPVDGGWTSWSEWSICAHMESDTSKISTHFKNTHTLDHCLCRTRSCNNPAPANGGRTCTGLSVSVTNCTVHGGWTDWSPWSACSATCGNAEKVRRRSCTNPAPAHGGRICVGQDVIIATCTDLPPCPILSIDGGWSDWGEWQPVTSSCGCVGYRKRYRYCNSPTPYQGGLDCIGNDVEYSNLSKAACDSELTRLNDYRNSKSITTDWIDLSNYTGQEFYKKRYKYICKASMKQTHIKISFSSEVQYCTNPSCSSTVVMDANKGNVYSSWTECSRSCGGGTQNRSCIGEKCHSSIQSRECNMHPCPDEWTCWTEWSPCNVSCGWGVRTRHRNCKFGTCKGSPMEQMACEAPPCNSLLGWESWSSWSLCDKNDEQHRKRKCHSSVPNPNICQGKSVETRMCISDIGDNNISPQSIQAATTDRTTKVILAFSFLGLVLGVLIGVCLMYAFFIRKKKVQIPSSPHYITAKQNPYISVPLNDRSFKKHNSYNSNSSVNYPKFDECSTLSRKANGLNNVHSKQEVADNHFF